MSSIGRPAHKLQAETTVTIPRHFIFFDTETYQTKLPDNSTRQDFKLGWCVYYRRPFGRHLEKTEWFYLDSIESFWSFVFAHTYRKEKLWVIARNVVFDFTVLKGWKYLKENEYKLKFFHNNGVSAIVNVVCKQKTIVFLDSMNWFVESIEKTGQRLGLPKLKIDFDTCTDDELSTYCHRDVEIDFENFKKFIEFLVSNRIARLCYTRASTAMAAYLLNHYKKDIYIHNNREAIELERESYKGGRCECFYIGELNNANYYIVDVNSLYPFVMRNNPYPVRYCKIQTKTPLSEFSNLLDSYSIVAKVNLDVDLPVYAIKRKRLIFPLGYFTATLCTPELKYAIEHNQLRYVHKAVIYEQDNIFTSYVDTFYKLRREFKDTNQREYDEICKKLLNSLYGKFGQKGERWIKIGEAPYEQDREEITFNDSPRYVTRIRYLLGEVFQLKGYTESFNSFPAIAAHVTAYARMYLWELIQQAGYENCYYCDTDSLMVNETGLLNLASYINDTELGKLKVEEHTREITIRGLKDYDTVKKHTVKGVRKNARLVQPNTYEQELWPTFRGLLKSPDVNTYCVKHTLKHLSREYTKGNVTDSGKINPFILYEI